MKLILPDPSIQGKFSHVQDTFRELATMWSSFIQIEYSKNHVHPYIEYQNTLVCLYDRPVFEEWSEHVNADYVLFGNPAPPGRFKHESSWIFWARHPIQLEARRMHGLLPYAYRTTETIFAGKIETQVQHQRRTQVDWSQYIEDFSCPINGERKYTQEEYLNKIASSKYGLCLPGYGRKCNREIELLALGTVPIITPGVDVSNYADPLVEGVHYIYAEDGNDLRKKIHGTTEIEWIRMHQNGVDWYERNCSPRGSFNTTINIIEKFMTSPDSFATLATNSAHKDLELFYTSLRLQYPKHNLYIAGDNYVKQWAATKNDPHIHVNTVLEKYANMNRLEMEAKNLWTEFMLEKCTAIDDALANHEDTLFLDCDQCIMNSIRVHKNYDIGLSAHNIHKHIEDEFGKYNGGFVYVRDKDFTTWWRDNTPHSKFKEQGILEKAPETFNHFEFDFNDNFGWWRVYEQKDPQSILNNFGYINHLEYDSKPVTTLHCHFFDLNQRLGYEKMNFAFCEQMKRILPKTDPIRQTIENLSKVNMKNYDVQYMIYNWSKTHENVGAYEHRLKLANKKYNVFNVDENKTLPHWIQLDDSYYFTKQFHRALEEFDGDFLFHIQGDSKLPNFSEADFNLIERQMIEAYEQTNFGVYAPNVDWTFWDNKSVLANTRYDHLKFVRTPDCTFWCIHKDIVNEYRKYVNVMEERNKFGWSVDLVICAISYLQKRPVLRDYRYTVQHPPSTEYDRTEAEQEMHELPNYLPEDIGKAFRAMHRDGNYLLGLLAA